MPVTEAKREFPVRESGERSKIVLTPIWFLGLSLS